LPVQMYNSDKLVACSRTGNVSTFRKYAFLLL
jgi:hypothetical protein